MQLKTIRTLDAPWEMVSAHFEMRGIRKVFVIAQLRWSGSSPRKRRLKACSSAYSSRLNFKTKEKVKVVLMVEDLAKVWVLGDTLWSIWNTYSSCLIGNVTCYAYIDKWFTHFLTWVWLHNSSFSIWEKNQNQNKNKNKNTPTSRELERGMHLWWPKCD